MTKICGNALRAFVAAFIVALLTLSGASAQGGNPIKIGLSLALTGAGASPSKVINTALDIWRDDVNAKGGLLGRPVELVIYDDQSTPANVPGIYTKLITVDKVDLLLGPYGTNFVAPGSFTETLPLTLVPLERVYRSALVYYLVGKAALRDEEEGDETRAGKFLAKHARQLLTVEG